MCPEVIFNELREKDLDPFLIPELIWLEAPGGLQDSILNPLSGQAAISFLWALDEGEFQA